MVAVLRWFGNIRPDKVEAAAVAEHPRAHTSPDNNNHPAGIHINPYISGGQGRNNQPHAKHLGLYNRYMVEVKALGTVTLVGQDPNHSHIL